MTIQLVIAGIAGRMGQRIQTLASQDPAFRVAYGLEAPGNIAYGFPLLSPSLHLLLCVWLC